MAKPIQMPSLSPTMKEGKITKWLKKEGDKVSSGQAIAEVETDKSNLEIEAYDDGILIAITVKENELAPVGAPIAYIGEKGEKVDLSAAKAAPATPSAPPKAEAPKAAPPPPKAAPPAPPKPAAPAPAPRQQQNVVPLRREEPKAAPAPQGSAEGGRVRASPLAKKMAQQQGLDLGSLQGSGPQGRIIKRDIEAAMQGGAGQGGGAPARKAPAFVPAPAVGRVEPEAVPLSQMRKVIAQRMGEVKPGVPHFYLTVEVDMGAALQLREQAKAVEAKISVNDIIVKAAGVALRRYPAANVSFQGDHLLKFANADVGVAVAIEDGLITPVVRDADQKGLGQISAEVKDLAERAWRRALKPAEYSGGAITVSNLGMYGMDEFIAVINPPQASILAVGAVSDRVVARDGVPVVRKMMTATLSCDHRAIDGATGAEFLRELKGLLENPLRLLL